MSWGGGWFWKELLVSVCSDCLANGLYPQIQTLVWEMKLNDVQLQMIQNTVPLYRSHRRGCFELTALGKMASTGKLVKANPQSVPGRIQPGSYRGGRRGKIPRRQPDDINNSMFISSWLSLCFLPPRLTCQWLSNFFQDMQTRRWTSLQTREFGFLHTMLAVMILYCDASKLRTVGKFRNLC